MLASYYKPILLGVCRGVAGSLRPGVKIVCLLQKENIIDRLIYYTIITLLSICTAGLRVWLHWFMYIHTYNLLYKNKKIYLAHAILLTNLLLAL